MGAKKEDYYRVTLVEQRFLLMPTKVYLPYFKQGNNHGKRRQ